MGMTFTELQIELKKRILDEGDALWTLNQKQRALKSAIRLANDRGSFRVVVDETLTVVANTLEYTLPAAIPAGRNVFKVSVEGLANQPYTVKYAWDTTESHTYAGGVETVASQLVLQRAFSEAVGKKIRLEYWAPHQVLTNSNDTVSLPDEFLLAHALFLLHNETRTRADVDRKYHLDEAQKWFQVADALLTQHLEGLPTIDGRAIGQVL